MRIELAKITDEPLEWQETVDVPVAALDRPELLALGPVGWRGRLEPMHPGYLLRARLEYDQTLACDRCLELIAAPASSELEMLVLVELPDRGAEERELAEEDMGLLILDQEVLDTAPLIAEQLQLNVPMKPLCRPECLGLCPVCGANLNQGRCACGERPADPRWTALAAVRDRLRGDEEKKS